VRGLPGATEELAVAFGVIEEYGGKVPIGDAVKILALVDPHGSEAALIAYRFRRQANSKT
jgi:hypothetical protein